MFVFLSVSVVAYIFILSGARALRLRNSWGWAVTGVAVALLFSVGLILVNVPVVLHYFDLWPGSVPLMGDACCGGLLIVPTLLVVICGLVGGIKGMLALQRPGVRELFPSQGREETTE